MRTTVLAACIGEVTATPLERAGVATVQPSRPRLGSLVKQIAEQVPLRCGQILAAAGHRLEICRHVVLVDGGTVVLGSSAMALLRKIAQRPGEAVSVARLQSVIGGGDVDEVVVGLRSALGDSRLIQPVEEFGYRLAQESDVSTGSAQAFDPR